MRELKVTMIVSFPHPSKQQIVLNITDPQDPLFLYILELGEQEFHFLKQELCLLIEFQHFPQKFFEMLESCNTQTNFGNSHLLNQSMNSHPDSLMNKSVTSTNYLAIFHHNTHSNEALLIIQETTGFRQLNHLILRFKPASDSILKKHLSHLIKDKNLKLDLSSKEISRLSENLENYSKENKLYREDLSQIKQLHQQETQNLKIDHHKELNTLKESLFEENRIKIENKQQEKENVVTELENKISSLNKKLEVLSNEKLNLEDIKIKLEANERDLIGKNNILSSELKVYKEEVENLRNATSNLNHSTLNQEKSLTELKLKNEGLNSQLEEKEKSLQNLQKLVDNLNKQKLDLEESYKCLKITNNKLEEKLQASISEINKGNEIIQKLQNDMKSQKEKLKLKQQAMKAQEQLINQKQITSDELLKNYNELKREIEKKEDDLKSYKEKNEIMKAKLEEGEKKLEENCNVITYLNQRLNETYMPFKTLLKGENNFMPVPTGLNSVRTFSKEENNFNNNNYSNNHFSHSPNYIENNKINDFNNTNSSFGKGNQNYSNSVPNSNFNSNAFQSQDNFSNAGMILPETNFTNFMKNKENQGKLQNNFIIEDLKELKDISSAYKHNNLAYNNIPKPSTNLLSNLF